MSSVDYKKIGLEKLKWREEDLKLTYKTVKGIDLNIDLSCWIEDDDMCIGGKSSFNGEKYKVSIKKGVFKEIDNLLFTLLEGKCDENKSNRESFYIKVAFEEKYNRDRAKIYSRILYDLAVDIIICHELGHIMNGHLSYIHSLNNGNKTIHLDNSVSNDISNIVSQVLEMDADAFAATRLIDMITYNKNVDYLNRLYKGIIKDKNHAFWLSIVASTIVFSLQGLGRYRNETTLDESNYLPLRTRHYNFIKCLMASYNIIEKKEELKFTESSLMEFIPNVEEYVNLYLRGSFNLEEEEANLNNNLHELNNKHIQHYIKLNRLWSEEIRNELIQYTYFNLAY